MKRSKIVFSFIAAILGFAFVQVANKVSAVSGKLSGKKSVVLAGGGNGDTGGIGRSG